MATESKRGEQKCAHCGWVLINIHGVHMGVPFTHHPAYKLGENETFRVLVCGKCYDEITTDDHHVERQS